MPNNPKAVDNLKSWKPGESGNPAGKPIGAIHLSTKIQNMLNDPKFTKRLRLNDFSTDDGATPMDVISGAALVAAAKGDPTAREWLSKYGYGQKVDITSNGETLKTALVEFVGDNADDLRKG